MRAFIVDNDKSFIKVLKANLARKFAEISFGEIVVDMERDSTFKIAAKINQAVSNIKDGVIIFINLNLRCYGLYRQENAGAEILKYLRLTDDFYVSNGKGGYAAKSNRLRELPIPARNDGHVNNRSKGQSPGATVGLPF